MQVSRQTLRDGVGMSRAFLLPLVFMIGLWFYCNNYIDDFTCIMY